MARIMMINKNLKVFEYVDKNGKISKPGDKIRFDLYDGIPNVEFTVRENSQY